MAVANCEADARCGMEYQAALTLSSYGKMTRVLSACDSYNAVQLMLALALECETFLPCGTCVPCEIVMAMQEVVGEIPPEMLCEMTPQMTDGMVEEMQIRSCPDVAAGVFDPATDPARLRRLRSSGKGFAANFTQSYVGELPQWLYKVKHEVRRRKNDASAKQPAYTV